MPASYTEACSFLPAISELDYRIKGLGPFSLEYCLFLSLDVKSWSIEARLWAVTLTSYFSGWICCAFVKLWHCLFVKSGSCLESKGMLVQTWQRSPVRRFGRMQAKTTRRKEWKKRRRASWDVEPTCSVLSYNRTTPNRGFQYLHFVVLIFGSMKAFCEGYQSWNQYDVLSVIVSRKWFGYILWYPVTYYPWCIVTFGEGRCQIYRSMPPDESRESEVSLNSVIVNSSI